MTDLKDQTIPLLARLEIATLRRLSADDARYGEGPWGFRVDPDGVSHVALPPKGTHDATMAKLGPMLVTDLGGGHLAEVAVDPANPSGPRRTAFVIEGTYQAPGADDGSKVGLPVVRLYWPGEDGRWQVSKALDGERYPVPAGPVNVPPPPPVAGEG